ncbi:serine protease HTRA2, mitochondrial [Frankliniella occidentalis]|uniref:Serine protease HTRA2, mitochondrial n=1 Tax=Frankliniella occidentalis TaxID=133901 RepID=A0A6J1SKQ6_FRAOC|nr:serine protease HTRA2, mitochondrial [Frankliniella occidentalis]
MNSCMTIMALRSPRRICFQLKQTHSIFSVSSVRRLSKNDGWNEENNSSRSPDEGHQTFKSKWMASAGVLAAVGAGILWNYSDDESRSFKLFSTVSAARPTDGSDSGSGTPRQRFNFVADVVDIVAPSVVSLHTSHVVGGYQEISAASGFIVSSDGLIVTNAHAVYNKAAIQVTVLDGRVFEGRVVSINPKIDLATIRIPAKNLPVLKLGSSDTLRPGEWVISIGSPAGLSNSVSCGVVSTVGRKSTELRLPSEEMEYIQTDAPINQGNSGGPLVNLDGEAVGVNSMKLLHGISFAIPSNVVKDFLEDPNKVHKPSQKKDKNSARSIGITCLSLTPYLRSELEKHFKFPIKASAGVYVVDVHALSPAMRANLRPGDIIVAVNNNPVRSTDQLYEATIDNSVLFLTVLRGEMKLGLKIDLD